ncbi:MAG TPA: hypothetical protein VM533_15045 [Fimbriiglobus sp.]|nr:hypothetical protein [Fimbriiglobus sp.]
MDRAVASLRVEPAGGPEGVRFRLTYGPAGGRPILVHVYADPELLADEREEAEELLAGAAGDGVGRVREHLGRVVQVVHMDLDWDQFKDMGVVFAWMAAECLAAAGAGLLRDPNDGWWAYEGTGWVLLAGPAWPPNRSHGQPT